MSRRQLNRYSEHDHHAFEGFSDFLHSSVPAGVLSINYNGLPLDILHQPKGAKTTIVSFHTALSPNMKTTPVFSGGGVTADLNANLVFISDPTLELDEELKLAWFAGNRAQPLQRDLPAILAHIFDSQLAENIIFFGASGGGFAALYFSAFFPGSLAIPVNPQIIIKNFPEDSVLPYARTAFGAKDMTAAKEALTDQVTGDLRHIYRGGLSNTVAYLQNAMDSHHLYRHLTHFLRDVPTSASLSLLMEDWGRGHVPPPKELLASVMREVTEAAPNWQVALERLGFRSAPTADGALAWREGLVSTPS